MVDGRSLLRLFRGCVLKNTKARYKSQISNLKSQIIFLPLHAIIK